VQQLSNRLTNVAPEVRDQFAQIAGRVGGVAAAPNADFVAAETARFRIEPPARLSAAELPPAAGESLRAKASAIDTVESDFALPTAGSIGPLGPRKGMLLKR
jgi:hypothetical protein